MSDDEEPSRDELQTRVERLESYLFQNRRDVLKGAALGGSALGMLGFGAGSAAAQASTSDGDGNVGTPTSPVDLFADAVELQDASADPTSNGEMTLNGSDVKIHSGGTARNVSDLGLRTSVGGRGVSNSTQTVANSTGVDVELDAAAFEHSSIVDVDTANDQLVIQQAGIFAIFGSVAFSSSLSDGAQLATSIRVNGSNFVENKMVLGGSVGAAVALSTARPMSVNDVLVLRVFQSSGSSADMVGDERVSLTAVQIG